MKKLERIIVYSSLVVIFAIVAIFDLQITQGLYNPTNIVGRLGELLGELPLYLLGAFGMLVIGLYHPKIGNKWDVVLLILFIALAAGVSVYGGNHTVKLLIRNFGLTDLKGVVKYLIVFGIGAVVFGLSFLGTRRVKEDKHNEATLWAIMLIIMIACSLFVMQAGKMIWLRPRYRTLVALQDAGAIANAADYWLPFYHPQFFTSFSKYTAGGSLGFTEAQINQAMASLSITKWGKEEFYSFPSGHTMNTFITITVCFFPRFMSSRKEWDKYEPFTKAFVTLYAVFIAFTRIVRGAHNATDVTAGLIFGFIIFDLVVTLFYEGVGKNKILPKFESMSAKEAE